MISMSLQDDRVSPGSPKSPGETGGVFIEVFGLPPGRRHFWHCVQAEESRVQSHRWSCSCKNFRTTHTFKNVLKLKPRLKTW